MLVRSPISCPPLNETECAKVSAGPLPPQHSLSPGASAVFVVAAGSGRGVLGGVWVERGGSLEPGPALPSPPPAPHLPMYLCSDHITPLSHITQPCPDAHRYTVVGTHTHQHGQSATHRHHTLHRDVNTSASRRIHHAPSHHTNAPRRCKVQSCGGLTGASTSINSCRYGHISGKKDFLESLEVLVELVEFLTLILGIQIFLVIPRK